MTADGALVRELSVGGKGASVLSVDRRGGLLVGWGTTYARVDSDLGGACASAGPSTFQTTPWALTWTSAAPWEIAQAIVPTPVTAVLVGHAVPVPRASCVGGGCP